MTKNAVKDFFVFYSYTSGVCMSYKYRYIISIHKKKKKKALIEHNMLCGKKAHPVDGAVLNKLHI